MSNRDISGIIFGFWFKKTFPFVLGCCFNSGVQMEMSSDVNLHSNTIFTNSWDIECCCVRRTILMLTVFSQCMSDVPIPLPGYKIGQGFQIVWFQLFKLFPVSIFTFITIISTWFAFKTWLNEVLTLIECKWTQWYWKTLSALWKTGRDRSYVVKREDRNRQRWKICPVVFLRSFRTLEYLKFTY